MVCVHYIDFFISVQVVRNTIDVNSPLIITEHQIPRSLIHVVSLTNMWEWTLNVDNICEPNRVKRTVNHQICLVILQVLLVVFIVIQSDKILIFAGGVDASHCEAHLFLFAFVFEIWVNASVETAGFLLNDGIELEWLNQIIFLDVSVFGGYHGLGIIFVEINVVYLIRR